MGDGELHEGQVWEAALTAPKRCLANLTAIVDANRLKAMDDGSHCGKPLAAIANRWAGFGWRVCEVDGHDMAEICAALDWATEDTSRPAVIVAHTVKGKGFSFVENQPGFHNGTMTPDEFERALRELEVGLQGKLEVAG